MPISRDAANVQLLLRAYLETLEALEAMAEPRRGRFAAAIRAVTGQFRFQWALPFLISWHFNGVLLSVERALQRRSARGLLGIGEDKTLERVTHLRATLPSRSEVLRVGSLVKSYFPAALAIALSAIFHQRLSTSLSTVFGIVETSLKKTKYSYLLSFSMQDVTIFIPLAASLACLVLYVLLWPAGRAYRLKRRLLNLYPESTEKVHRASFLWSTTRSVGVYSFERRTLKSLCDQSRIELPIDLLVSSLAPVSWAILTIYLTYSIVDTDARNRDSLAKLIVGILEYLILVSPAAIRLAMLVATWRARTGHHRSTWLLADAFYVPWRIKPLRCRSPLLMGWLSLLPLSFGLLTPISLFFTWKLWFSTARDLRNLGKASLAPGSVRDFERLRRIKPWAQALAMGPFAFTLVLPLIVLFRAPRYVRSAQEVAGLERPISRHIAWLAFIWPVQCVLLQRELNRLWHSPVVRSLQDPVTIPDIPQARGGARRSRP